MPAAMSGPPLQQLFIRKWWKQAGPVRDMNIVKQLQLYRHTGLQAPIGVQLEGGAQPGRRYRWAFHARGSVSHLRWRRHS